MSFYDNRQEAKVPSWLKLQQDAQYKYLDTYKGGDGKVTERVAEEVWSTFWDKNPSPPAKIR